MKWKRDPRGAAVGQAVEIERFLTSPALATRRLDRAGELDHAEVEIDDEDALAGVERREAAAGGDDPGERQFLLLGEAPRSGGRS